VGEHFNMDDGTAQAGTRSNRSSGVVLPSLIREKRATTIRRRWESRLRRLQRTMLQIAA
jgi:hypothetical protein